MGSGYYCKGVCERFKLKKRPNYPNGDMYCVPCGKSYPLNFTATLLEFNHKYKICPCCHCRVRSKARPKSGKYQDFKERYEYLNTFEQLDMIPIVTEKSIHANKGKIPDKGTTWYQRNKEKVLAYQRNYYREHIDYYREKFKNRPKKDRHDYWQRRWKTLGK